MRRVTSVIGILVAALVLVSASAFAQAQPRKASTKAAATASSPVNLNTATAAQLETLPGIGAASAKRIVEYREKNGAFKKIEELMNVKGIGEKSFLKLKPLITVGTDKAEKPSGQK
jgi:competence protein ComEA